MASINNSDPADMRRALEDLKAEVGSLAKRLGDWEKKAGQPSAKRLCEQLSSSSDLLSKTKKSYVDAITKYIDNRFTFTTMRRMHTIIADKYGISYDPSTIDSAGMATIQAKVHPKSYIAPSTLFDNFINNHHHVKYRQLELRYCLEVIVDVCISRGAVLAESLDVTRERGQDDYLYVTGDSGDVISKHDKVIERDSKITEKHHGKIRYARNVLSGISDDPYRAPAYFEKWPRM